MNKKGFTLIELLAVIVILGIVVAIAIPGINSVIRNSRQKSLNSEAKIIQSAALRKTVGNPTYSFSHINKDNLKTELEADGSKFDYIGIDNNNGKITVTLIKDNMVGYSSNDDEITNAKIYGLHWDGGTGYTRLDDAEGLVASVGTDTLNPHNDFDYEDIYKDIVDVEEDGNMFVKIPRFYIKKEVSGNSWTWRISKKKHDEDYYLPAVFQDQERGILLPSVLVGKYHSSFDTQGKLMSLSGKVPASDISIINSRNLTKMNGEKYQLLDIHTTDLIQVLFIIEFKTLNSQSIMSGYTKNTNTEIIKTGNADNVISKSGSPISNDTGINAMTYRGIENIYGNLRQHVDGVNVNNYKVYVSKNYKGYVSDKFNDDYKGISYDLPTAVSGSQFTVKLGFDPEHPYVNLPEVGGSSAQSAIKDNFLTQNIKTYPNLGGYYSHSTAGGLFNWYINGESTFTNVVRGTRLMKTVS